MVRRTSTTPENPSQEENPKKNEMENYIDSIKNDPEKGVYEVTDTRVPDFIPAEKCWEIIKKYAEINQLDIDTALAGITALIQKGGTNQSKKGLTVQIGNTSFDLNKFRQLLTNMDSKFTVRKFAKGIRKIIILISQKNKWEGPLAKELLRVNPNLNITPELAPWCNEIHSDNYDCPNEIRDALIRREEQYKIIARNKTQQTQQPNKKPRKTRGKKKR
jgi:hypothetical protein